MTLNFSYLAVLAVLAFPDAAVPYKGPKKPVRATATCEITRVVDGDTIECKDQGKVRLIGIDSPEQDQPPFGADATKGLKQLLPKNGKVKLELDVEQRDRYGRLLGYVWHDGEQVNWWMVRRGWAITLTYPPNVQYEQWYVSALDAAQREKAGLWAVNGFECSPKAHRRKVC